MVIGTGTIQLSVLTVTVQRSWTISPAARPESSVRFLTDDLAGLDGRQYDSPAEVERLLGRGWLSRRAQPQERVHRNRCRDRSRTLSA